jgi:hypothetical protein
MSNIGPTYPAHIAVSQAEFKLAADETTKAATDTIKFDQQRVESARRLEAEQAKATSVDIVT